MDKASPRQSDLQPYLTVRVDPNDMVQFVHDLMMAPRSKSAPDTSAALAQAQWGDTTLARAAQIRWSALNRAFGDARVSTWTTPQKRDQLHVPAALIAAAGVARLKLAEDEVVFDIPTLLDATLELCEAVGHA
ncbi:MAG: hypothetical protein QOG17_950 [Gammaproteobacteria bacterium]|jgi:hypothetical protein|nr:hypothetical protein [Gammaproteobacteria bacterium]